MEQRGAVMWRPRGRCWMRERRWTMRTTTTGTCTALIAAARRGMVETIPVLLEAGAVVDQVSNDGETALWRAAAFGQVGAIEALLQAGADINHAANNGLTPLAAARAKHHEAAALALVEAGATQ